MEECQEKGRKKTIVENRRKMEECQKKGRKKTTEKEGKSLKTGGNGGKMEE